MRLYLCLGLFLTLIACQSDTQVAQSTPEESIKGFFEAMKVDNFEKGRLFLTTSSQESLQHFETNLKMTNKEEIADLMAPFKMEVSKVSCSENQGATFCKVCCFNEGEATIEMVQQDEKWFAVMEFVY